ncbi:MULTISPECIES: hypothetical protein [unclassified Streptomyces]|uniref:hypothetical protein n=1 Tax=Streptomyces sp. SCUT-3 TaxID=2684469 RepID=UPI0021755CF3|nr:MULTISPECIES: hypothetical protein [unclassified Streptomyces]MCZ2523327.1 hypothetical protein [Streptomyces sp. HB2AG]
MVRHGAEGGTPSCDVVTVPVRQGLEAVDIMRLRTGVGPVLHDRAAGTLGFLVPPGAACGWDLPGVSCTRSGVRARSADGWLLPPRSTAGRHTDPAVLHEALGEAQRTLAAADGSLAARG